MPNESRKCKKKQVMRKLKLELGTKALSGKGTK